MLKNTFHHRIRMVLESHGYPPVQPLAGWKFEPSETNPTSGKLSIWLSRDEPPLICACEGVNPDESTGPGLTSAA